MALSLSFFFVLTRKRNKKSQGKPDPSGHFAVLARTFRFFLMITFGVNHCGILCKGILIVNYNMPEQTPFKFKLTHFLVLFIIVVFAVATIYRWHFMK